MAVAVDRWGSNPGPPMSQRLGGPLAPPWTERAHRAWVVFGVLAGPPGRSVWITNGPWPVQMTSPGADGSSLSMKPCGTRICRQRASEARVMNHGPAIDLIPARLRIWAVQQLGLDLKLIQIKERVASARKAGATRLKDLRGFRCGFL